MDTEPIEISVPIDHHQIQGTLTVPGGATALVIFAHGSGSGRFSPRNRLVAETLVRANLGTLLLDLLTRDEDRVDELTAHLRFDIGLLAGRVVVATEWVAARRELRSLRLGYFGASTGAAAALIAAARRSNLVRAVVSRGGRPDLAGSALAEVRAPTLLIVGGQDAGVLELNQEALRALGAPRKELRIVPGATHLFEEPGTLEEVGRLARRWFEEFLVKPEAAARRGE